MNTSAIRYLDIYLDDHRALALGGEELAERMHENHRSSAWEERLAWLVEHTKQDHAVIEEIRDRLGVEGGAVKGALAIAGERLGRLKLNGHLLSASPLSPVIEAEAMIAVVRAKQTLWRGLHAASSAWPQLADYDFSELGRGAEEQIELLESIHFDLAVQAFSHEGS